MKERIIELISNKEYKELKKLLNEMNESDISEILDEMSDEDAAFIFRLLEKDVSADVFSRMETSTQEKLIENLRDNEIKEVTSQLFVDDAVDLISEMPAILVKRILQNTDASKRKYINELLKYPEDSAGSIMTIEFVDLHENMTVRDAFERIRKVGKNKETIYTCYVIDDKRKLVGVTTVKDLLLCDPEKLVGDIMETSVITINTHVDKEEVAQMFDKYDFLAMPVVDMENRLVGIITIDDAMDVMSEEANEDFEIMAAITPSENSYFNTSVFEHTKNRIIWLLVLMLSATITGTIITHYQNAFSSLPILVAFIPMLMDTGGNCGAQSSTLIIRGLATGEIELKDILKCWFKEIRIALMVGACLAVVNGIRIFIQYQNPILAMVIGITLMFTVIISKSLGCILPMAAKKLNLDPAIMASPFITTIVDACSILIYFNIAVVAFGI
ncbi:MAG: magnesium transporter [Erysipelotrichaceae bacterium]